MTIGPTHALLFPVMPPPDLLCNRYALCNYTAFVLRLVDIPSSARHKVLNHTKIDVVRQRFPDVTYLLCLLSLFLLLPAGGFDAISVYEIDAPVITTVRERENAPLINVQIHGVLAK